MGAAAGGRKEQVDVSRTEDAPVLQNVDDSAISCLLADHASRTCGVDGSFHGGVQCKVLDDNPITAMCTTCNLTSPAGHLRPKAREMQVAFNGSAPEHAWPLPATCGRP